MSVWCLQISQKTNNPKLEIAMAWTMTYWISWTFWTTKTFKTFTDLPDLWTFRIFQGPSGFENTSETFSPDLLGKFQGPFEPSWPSRSARDLLGTFQGLFWDLPDLPDFPDFPCFPNFPDFSMLFQPQSPQWGKDWKSFNLLRIGINTKYNFRFKHIKDCRCGRNGKTKWLYPWPGKWVANSSKQLFTFADMPYYIMPWLSRIDGAQYG